VFGNAKEYGVRGDGATDGMVATQKAIDAGDSSGTRATGTAFGITGQPAVVCFPTGTYSIKSTLSNRVSTVLGGDPTSRPTIKVSAIFTSAYLLIGYDTRYTGIVAFYQNIRNLLLDTTTISSQKGTWMLGMGSCMFVYFFKG
jgi:glucan 1,3-beta-glucosidase